MEEMCIRDSARGIRKDDDIGACNALNECIVEACRGLYSAKRDGDKPVSYTHLLSHIKAVFCDTFKLVN